MHCILTRADGAPIHTQLDVRPSRYSHAALGGPDTAELAVAGDNSALTDVLNWLACKVVIYNESALPVWWGLVQAVTVTLDGVEYGLDASEIVNRMAVLYTDESGEATQTLWAEDAHSIGRYGIRAVRESIRAENAAAALAQATRYVAERSAPLRSVRAASGPDGARLACVGYWRTLDWRWWSQAAGQQLQDEDANTTELLGYSVTGTDIGIYRSHRIIGRVTADLQPFQAEDRIVVDNSASNDGVYEVAAADDRATATSYTNTTISFDPADDVLDASEGLDQFRAYDLIRISGAANPANNGSFFIKEILDNGAHITVTPGTIITEAAGDTISITAANQLTITTKPPATEMPGATITLASQAVKIAQSFTTDSAGAWELSEVWIRAARIGSPADNLKIEVCSDSTGAPGTVLKSATLTGSALPLLESIDWQQWAFDSAQSLAASTTYWVVVSRTGAAADACYRVGILQAEEGLSSSNLLLWNGAAWVARTVASGLGARLSIRVYGQRITTTQIEDIVAEIGDWLAGTAIRTASGLRSRLYRSEEEAQTALSEIKALLEFGTAAGQRLLARVSADGVLFVDAQPNAKSPLYIWTAAGLRDRWGLPLPEGELPVGEWVAFELAGVVDTFGPAFLEAAEFDVATGSVRPTFRAEQAVQSLARLSKATALPDLAARLGPYFAKPGGAGVSRVAVSTMIATKGGSSAGGGGSAGAGTDPIATLLTTRGDLIRRNATAPERYALSVPAANVLNVLGVANGETDPTWKALFDATNPATLTVSAAAAPGTSLIAAHRDHVHPITSSSNPGAAASLLASNASGQLQLAGLITAYVRPAADSTTALQLQNAAGTAILTVDTTNSRLGIGATPAAKLHVAMSSAEILRVERLSSAANTVVAILNTNGTTYLGRPTSKFFAIGPNLDLTSGAYLTIDASGNVGIGTASMSYSFVVSSATGGMQLDRTGGNDPFILLSRDGSAVGQIRGDTTGITFAKADGSADYLHIRSDTGRIGIGTLSPGTILHIIGDATLIGNLVTDTTTGTKIGTATTQKLGFFNATPVVQPTALTAANASALNTGDATSDTVIGNIRTRVGEIETKLKALGLLA